MIPIRAATAIAAPVSDMMDNVVASRSSDATCLADTIGVPNLSLLRAQKSTHAENWIVKHLG